MILTIDEYKSRVDMLDKTITELVGAIQVLYDSNEGLRDRCEYLRKLCVASTVKLTRYHHETPLCHQPHRIAEDVDDLLYVLQEVIAD